MTSSQALPPPQGPEYAHCTGCGHIEPDHRPDAGSCLSCDCGTYRPTAPTAAEQDKPHTRSERYAAAIYEGANPGYRWADAHPDDRLCFGWDGECAAAVADEEQRSLRGEIEARRVELLRVNERLDLLEQGALERSALLEEARDALAGAGINEAHGGESWPRLVPAIEELAAERDRLRAELAQARGAALTEAADLRHTAAEAQQPKEDRL